MGDGAATVRGRGLRHSYGHQEVLRGIDIEVAAGEIVALMGPSGSGKSTLLHILAGLIVPTAGEVYLEHQRIDDARERDRADLRLNRMGFVFQFGDLIPELTIAENVELPLRLTGSDREAARLRAREVLSTLQIGDVAGRRLSEVSGGQIQRAAVARAVITRPRVIFADEPTGSLDTVSGERVMSCLVTAAREAGSAVVLVTHELSVAAYADRDIQIRDGRLRTPATPLGQPV